ncbi:MAG: hypothetical protein ACOX05_00110 [Bacillota bacterium]|jgi:hypothetical protein
MNIGFLLENLISIAQIPKTDFALSMNMTPSGLSKILTGKRLPLIRDNEIFSGQAARYFAGAIYEKKCYLKFKDIFPVIYDFESKEELEMFLAQAIEYRLHEDFAIKNKGNRDYSKKELSFLGNKNVLNMFCILVSEGIRDAGDSLLEFYSTLPLLSDVYMDLFWRVKILVSRKSHHIKFNHFLKTPCFEKAYDYYDINVLSFVFKAEQYVDFNLWKIKQEITTPFLLLKGQFLLLFSAQMDGKIFLMTLIKQKGYLATFFNYLMKKDAEKISYNREEALDILEKDPSSIARLIDEGMDAVYNFIHIGYLVNEDELENVVGSKSIRTNILRLFKNVLKNETVFYITVDAMVDFYSTGRVIVPLVGVIDIDKKERLSYLKRFGLYINEKGTDKIKIINSMLPKVTVLCLKDMSFVYVFDPECEYEKIHCLHTNIIGNLLDKQVKSGSLKLLEFSSELWDIYIDELSNR